MKRIDWQDVLGGLLMIGIGAFFALYATSSLSLGSIRRMGAGMFPLGVGIILVILGILIVLPALRRGGEPIKVQLWTPIVICGAVALFAFSVRKIGVVPAIFLTVFISSLADLRLTPLYGILLGAGLSVMIWLIFSVGLGLPIPMFAWRW